MYKRLVSRVRAINIWLMAPVLGLSLFVVVLVSFMAPVAQAATTSSNLNFQARLLNNSGGVVPDGIYNIDFKIYNADSTTGSVGTCSSACLWEETRKVNNSQGVTVINGYFSVNLGSVTAFPAINWDQQLWLTMNIGGTANTASPTWDGEMQNAGHSVALTALPYSFVAGQLAKTSGAHRGTLAFNTVANDPAILLPDASGTVCLQNAAACGFESTTGTDFIQNQSASPQSANFDISGSGFIGTGLQVPLIQTADSNVANTANLVLRSGNQTGTSLSSGNVTIKSGDAGSGSSSSSGNISIDAGTKSAGGATGSISIGTANASAVSIGNSTAALTLTGSSGSNFVLNGITISAAELNLLDGHGNAGSTLVDTNDAVTTAIIGTGALDAGSISSNFGSIDTGADNITTTGAVSGNSFDRTTSGTLSVGTAQASAITLGGSSTVTTATGGLTVTSGKNFTVNADVFTDLTGTGIVDISNALSIDQSASLTWTGLEAISNNNAAGFIVSDSSSSKAVLTVDTSGDAVILGKAGASGLTGKLTFQNATNSNALSIQAGTTTTGYTLTLPTALPGSTQCLQSSNAGVLSFVTCLTGTYVNTVGTYSSSNHYGDGASITGTSLTLGSADATHPGLVDTSAQTFAGSKTFTGAVLVANTADSTAAFQVQDSTTAALFNVNTSDGYVIDNGTSPPGNIIENPSFEAVGSTSASGWYTPSASQVITVSSANAHSGNNELQITGNSNTHAVTTKYFAVHPGDTIYTEAYVKNSAGANGDAGIYLEFSDKDKGAATFTSADTGLPGTSYVLKSITTTVPASKFFVRMAASVKATATTGTFYFDDFYLKKANEQAPLLISNVSTTAFQVQNASSQTVLGVDTSSSKIFTTIPDSGSAVGFTFNTPSYTTSGAKLLSLQNNGAEKFYVDKDGNIVNQGNITATGGVSIGSGQTYKINGTPLASTNLSDTAQLAYLAGTGPQTFTGNNKFTGTVLSQTTSATAFQVQNATSTVFAIDASGNKTILGTGGGSGLTGVAQFNYSGSSGSITIAPLDPSSTGYTLNLPAENGTFCTSAASSTANCTNFASASSVTTSLAGKLNKGLVDTSSHAVTAVEGNLYAFSNTSSGIASGVLKLNNNNNTDNALYVTGSTDYASGKAYILVNNTNGTPSGNLIDLQSNAADQFTVDASGNVVAAGNISIATGKLYEINGVQITSAALSNNSDLAKLAANQTFTGDNTFSSASNSFTGNGANLSSLNASNVSSGSLNDARLSANVAFRNQDNTFASTNTFSPTANNVGTTINQTSGTATSGSVLDVQAVGGAHFLQITNAAAGEGAVTLQSVGATRDLTLNSASGIIKLGSATTALQKAASAFTIDLANAGTSTLTLSNSNGSNVASLSVTGDIGVASGRAFKVGATSGVSIGTCGASAYVSSFLSSGGIVTGGSCTTLPTAGDSITVNSSAATDANFIDVASTSSVAGTSWTLAGASPSSISIAVAAATNTLAGIVTAGSQAIGGDKTLSGVTTFSNATTNINSSTIATTQGAITLFNTNATNVTEYGAATTISVGATSGTITLKNANQIFGNAAGSGVFTNNGATLNTTLAVANDSDGGALGGTPSSPLTAGQSVDIYTSISINQTTAGQTITLPTPTASTSYGRLLYVSNVGTASFIIGGVSINPGQAGTLMWSNTNGGASWQFAGAGADSIANQNSLDQTANFRISGTGRANISFTSPVFDSISGALGIGSVNATSITVGNTGTTPTTSITLQTKGAGTIVKTATDVINAFQVQNNAGASILSVDSLNRNLRVYENGGSTNYSLIYYDTATSTANYTASAGTVAVGSGAGAISVVSGSGAAITITANAASTWKTNTGTLTIQSGSSSDLILNPGSSIISVNGSSVVKLGSSAGDPGTCTLGAIVYNSTTNLFRGCQGSSPAWATLSSTTQTLQQGYTASTGSTTPEIKLDSTRNGLDIQDADIGSGSPLGVLFAVRGTNNAGLGTSIFNVNSSSNTVNIGTSDTTGTLLVLDTDTDATVVSGGTTTNAATEVDGAMFYSTSSRTFVCGENGAWVSCLGGLRDSSTAPSTAITSATDTNFTGGTNNSYAVPVNDCQAGRVYRVTSNGTYTQGTTGTITATYKLKFGATTVATIGPTTAVTASTTREWMLQATITCIDSTHVEAQGIFTYWTTSSTAAVVNEILNTAQIAQVIGNSQTITLSAAESATTNTPTIQQRSFVVEGLGP